LTFDLRTAAIAAGLLLWIAGSAGTAAGAVLGGSHDRAIVGAALDWRSAAHGEQVLVDRSGQILTLIGESAAFQLGSQVRFLARPVPCLPGGSGPCFAMVRVLSQFVGPVETQLPVRILVLSARAGSVTVAAPASPAAAPRLVFKYPATAATVAAAGGLAGKTAVLTLARRVGGAVGPEARWSPYSWTAVALAGAGSQPVVVDRTLACTTRTIVPPFAVSGHAAEQIKGRLFPPGASVQTGPTQLDGFLLGYPLPVFAPACSATSARVALTATGLHASIFPDGLTTQCYPHGTLLVRLRVTERNGSVTSGALAVRMAKSGQPIFYALVSSRRASVYASFTSCKFG